MDNYVEVKYFDRVIIWRVFPTTAYTAQYFASKHWNGVVFFFFLDF